MRCLILSDIHANLQALEAVLADAPAGLPVWCLGDLVGYGPSPNECVQLLCSLDHVCIVGNHDWAAMDRVDTQEFNPDAEFSIHWTQGELTPASKAYLEKLPVSLVEGAFTLVHGSPREPVWEYILRAGTACSNFAHFHTSYCLVGHTHVPVVFRLHSGEDGNTCEGEPLSEGTLLKLGQDRLIINPGSVGQPRDGDSRASYAILDTEDMTFEYRRVCYDIEKTQEWMKSANLPPRNIMRLSYGW